MTLITVHTVTNKFVNSILWAEHSIYLGGFDVNWRLQHNILHHTYTNITHVDEDIEPRLKMRWSPSF
jgi:linoleoyl-CoA desaturase